MSYKDDPDYEPTKFRRKELSTRDSRLTAIMVVSFLTVLLGTANVVLFQTIPSVPANITRNLTSCSLLGSSAPIGSSLVSLWAASGTFAILAFIIAPVAKATRNAWSRESAAFVYLAPPIAILALGIAAASALLGACYVKNFADLMTKVEDAISYPTMYYALIDLTLAILGLVLFFQLLIVWSQIRSKRSRSEETKLKEEEEEKKEKLKQQERKDQPEKQPDNPQTTTQATTPVTEPVQTAPAKEAPAEKMPPNVYFIQAPAPPPAPQGPPQEAFDPYNPYNPNNPYNPYNEPYNYPAPSLPLPYPPSYLPPPTTIPPPMTLPPPPPPMRRPRGRGRRPFGRRFAVRISPGYQSSPWGY